MSTSVVFGEYWITYWIRDNYSIHYSIHLDCKKNGIQRFIHTPNEVGYSGFDAVFTNAVIEVFSIQYTIHIT